MSYLADQEISTVSGRAGRLTGETDLGGSPYVRFADGATYAVRREGIAGPVVHTFADTRQAYDHSQFRDEILDGDVLFVPGEGIAAVLYGAWPVAVNEPADRQYGAFHGFTGGPGALAAKDGGQYADSVRVARALITPAGPAAQPGGAAQRDFPAANPLAGAGERAAAGRPSRAQPASRPRGLASGPR